MNLDDITDIDYRPVKRVLKEFNIKIEVRIMTDMFKVRHYYLLMYLNILEIQALKNLN